MSNELDLSRRKFLKNAGIVAGVAALSSTVLTVTAGEVVAQTAKPMAHPAAGGQRAFRGRMFFTNDLEFKTLSEACERIFPKDETGPGAKELAVPYFIDNQLAGAYGYNAREYMMGPFYPGAPTQGYQTNVLRKDIFKLGLAALNDQARTSFKKSFPDITDAQKDQILRTFEAGTVVTQGFPSAYFFSLLRMMTLAGAYSDPIYNGNNNMDGWKMKQYPGAQMAYNDSIENAKFDIIAPASLADMQ